MSVSKLSQTRQGDTRTTISACQADISKTTKIKDDVQPAADPIGQPRDSVKVVTQNGTSLSKADNGFIEEGTNNMYSKRRKQRRKIGR
jgi:hypothetical protein